MHKALYVIRDEHRALTAVLTAARYLVEQVRDHGASPDFETFHAIVAYIDAFPERAHHPKEDRYLFRRLELRAPELSPLLEDLRREHAGCADAIRELERSLRGFESGASSGFGEFSQTLADYIAFHFQHMEKEENHVLPAALRHLTEQDWEDIDAAFEANRDPFTGAAMVGEFDSRFRRIVEIIPAPYGLGAPWPQRK